MSGQAPRPPSRLLELVRRFGADAVSFLAFESSMRHWFDGPAPGTSEAVVAFIDTGKAWIAAGAPVAEAARIPHVAGSFVRSARENGRRACFFATECCEIKGFARLRLGGQPVWNPAAWPAMLATHRRLREQIRRPLAKGVTVRRLEICELEHGTPMRRAVDSLAQGMVGVAEDGADGVSGRARAVPPPG